MIAAIGMNIVLIIAVVVAWNAPLDEWIRTLIICGFVLADFGFEYAGDPS